MPVHHDLKLLELPRAGAQRYELEHAAQQQIAERPEQEPSPQDQRDGRTTLRPARASPRRNRVNAPHTPMVAPSQSRLLGSRNTRFGPSKEMPANPLVV